MPSGTIHRKVNFMVTGGRNDGDVVNQLMDSSARFHPGVRHRKDIVHSPAFVVGQLGHVDPDAGVLALTHKLIDKKYRVRQVRPLERLPGFREHRFTRSDRRHYYRWLRSL